MGENFSKVLIRTLLQQRIRAMQDAPNREICKIVLFPRKAAGRPSTRTEASTNAKEMELLLWSMLPIRA